MEKTDLEIYRGDSWRRNVQVVNSAKVSQDIQGWTIFFTAKANTDLADAQAIISKTAVVPSGTPVTSFLFKLDPADTEIAVGGYVYDLQLKTTSGDILTAMAGKLKIVADVTRRVS